MQDVECTEPWALVWGRRGEGSRDRQRGKSRCHAGLTALADSRGHCSRHGPVRADLLVTQVALPRTPDWSVMDVGCLGKGMALSETALCH